MLPRRERPLQGRGHRFLVWGASGAWGVIVQSLLFRQCQVLAGGWEPVLSLLLSAWLAGAASGTLAGGALPARARWPIAVSLAAIAGPAALLAIRFLPVIAAIPPGESAPVSLVPLAALVAALPGAASGLLFAANASRGADEPDRRAVTVYAAEAAGAAVGGGLVLAGTVAGVADSAAAVGASATLAAAALLSSGRRVAAVAVAALGTAAATAAPLADPATLAPLWRIPADARIAASRPTPYGWTVVAEREGQRELRHDGSLVAVDPAGPEAAWIVHPLAAAVDPPGRVLLAAGEDLLPELLRHPVTAVDIATDDPGREATWGSLSPAFAASLADPRVTRLGRDARAALGSGATRYRLILATLPPPLSLAGNRLQTEEFFRIAAGRLEPGGALALAIPFIGETPSPAEAFRAASILAALRRVFPDVSPSAGAGAILVTAGKGPFPGAAAVATRLATRGIVSPSFRPETVALLANPVRTEVILHPVAEASPAPANRDDSIVAGRAAFLEALGRLAPESAARLLEAVRRPVLPAVAGLILGLLLLLPTALAGPRGSSAALIGGIGAFSLVAETVLLYLFQARHGLLFSLVGVLLGAFMVGLSAGAAAGLLLPARRRIPPLLPAAGLLLAAVVILLLAPRGLGASPAGTALLIAAVGFLDGLAFPSLSSDAGPGSPQRLYAAEAAGAAAGNLAAAVVVLPLAGPPAAIAMSAALLASTALPALARSARR